LSRLSTAGPSARRAHRTPPPQQPARPQSPHDLGPLLTVSHPSRVQRPWSATPLRAERLRAQRHKRVTSRSAGESTAANRPGPPRRTMALGDNGEHPLPRRAMVPSDDCGRRGTPIQLRARQQRRGGPDRQINSEPPAEQRSHPSRPTLCCWSTPKGVAWVSRAITLHMELVSESRCRVEIGDGAVDVVDLAVRVACHANGLAARACGRTWRHLPPTRAARVSSLRPGTGRCQRW
jgi:hypothetical protein